MDKSEALDLSVNSELHFVLLERRENKQKIAALLQSITSASLGLGDDPIQQLVRVAQVGLQQLRQTCELSQPSSYPESRVEMKSVDSDRSFSRTDLQRCPVCSKYFPSPETLNHHINRRHAEGAGSRTERKLPSRKPTLDHLQQSLHTQYTALEKSISALNAQKSKLQEDFHLLTSSTACVALQSAIKLQEKLNSLLEQQRELLDAQAVRVKEIHSYVRSSEGSLCTVPASHTASLVNLVEPPKPPKPVNTSFAMRKRKLSRGSLETGVQLNASASMSRLTPTVPVEPLSGPRTSRKGLYRPNTRYHRPLELSFSDLKDDPLAGVREKAAELKGVKARFEVMVEKYGLELCALFKHSQDEIESTRKSLSLSLNSLSISTNSDTFQTEISLKKQGSDYFLANENVLKKAQMLESYITTAPDLPLKLLSKGKNRVPALCFSYKTDESLHANPIPCHVPALQPCLPLTLYAPTLTFYEGCRFSTASCQFITPIPRESQEKEGKPRKSGVRESLITLDMENSASFSIIWGDESEEEEEWRAISMEDAQRLGFFPNT